MEDLFTNPHSDIPDALWKSASPMERQLAAVEYWAELRGAEKTASARRLHKLKDFIRDNRTITGAAALLTGVPAGVLTYKGTAPNESGLTKRERKNLVTEAQYNQADSVGDITPEYKKKFLEINRKIAELEKENPKAFAALFGTGVGLGTAGLMRSSLRS